MDGTSRKADGSQVRNVCTLVVPDKCAWKEQRRRRLGTSRSRKEIPRGASHWGRNINLCLSEKRWGMADLVRGEAGMQLLGNGVRRWVRITTKAAKREALAKGSSLSKYFGAVSYSQHVKEREVMDREEGKF
ncbi:hypothetical protein LIER_11994 [Lithospermum erythrorhizon]|uniref:Uncharacterized protein n=1 Tax=Lithospermum erythrorhizon TaxID=34254 RepID=A0AAV3PRY9_LITER